MIRRFYLALLRLHPRAFRERFGAEMAGIFDEHAGAGRGGLLIDGIVSLFRQWALRPRYETGAAAAATSGIPLFHTFESSLPRRSALFQGAILSLVFFSAVTIAIGRGGHVSRLLIGAMHPRPHVLPVDRSLVAEGEPTTLIEVTDPAVDPLDQLARFYFGIIRALNILDRDRDRIISASEIAGAPTALVKLDWDHDGRLRPEECGYIPAPGVPERARLEFMQLNPVLAALDGDHDGEISAAEIGNSSVALRALDRNRDGALSPVEIIPDPIDGRTAMILSRLDANRDRNISLEERGNAEAAPLEELLDRADRDGDGVTTGDELTKELQLQDELKRQVERATRQAGQVE